VAVFVPPPRGGTQAQRTYFQDNFKMELIGANYPVAETREESLYTIMLDISDNPDYDSRAPVDEWNKPYDLGIKLERSADGTEIVNFGFAFDDLESMADWNLFLLYQAMANAAVPAGAEGGGEARDDRWRNKWLYLGFGAGLDMAYYLRPGTFMTDLGYVLPGAALAVEWHCLNFLSVELPLRIRFMHNGEGYLFTPGAALLVKAVLKPGAAMLEPYAGVEVNLAIPQAEVPWLSVLAGIQAGVRGGARIAVTLDFSAAYSLLGSSREDPYNTLKFSLLIGMKFGFYDRPAANPPAANAAPANGAAANQ
jgi:hypothetical protein